MMTEYCVRSGSIRHSRSSMPSVMYLMRVAGDVQSYGLSANISEAYETRQLHFPSAIHKHKGDVQVKCERHFSKEAKQTKAKVSTSKRIA